ncbi:MAG: universal stress protein [Bacteroidota bacterium]
MKKILVPCDFSPSADSALKIAAAIARKTNGEIVLLNIMLTPDNAKVDVTEHDTVIDTHSDTAYLKEAVQGLKQNLQSLVDQSGYDKVSYRIRSGNISQAVISFAEEISADMIVMGTQGDSSYDAMFVGSNAEKVVRMTAAPIITTRKLYQAPEFNKIVFACDLELKYDKSITYLKQLQELFGASIHLVFINTPAHFKTSKELEEKGKAFIEHYELKDTPFSIYNDLIEDDGIMHFAEANQADLIAITSRKKKGFARLLAGSVSEGVLTVSHIPVLIFDIKA